MLICQIASSTQDQQEMSETSDKPAALATQPIIPCMEFNDKCYQLHGDRQPWIVADSRCRDLGGILATVLNENTNRKLKGKWC